MSEEITEVENPFIGYTLDMIKPTKKQAREESNALKYYYENSLGVKRKEFDELMKVSGKWLSTNTIYNYQPFGSYMQVPEDQKREARIYALTYPAEKERYIYNAFYIFYDDRMFKASNFNDIPNVLKKLEEHWLFDFREHAECEISELLLQKDSRKETIVNESN